MQFDALLPRSVWRNIVPYNWRHAVGGALQPLVTAQTRRRAMTSLQSTGSGPPAVVGFFSGSSGIAASAQLAGRALDHLGIVHRKIDVGDLATPNMPDSLSASAWMFYLNAPELILLLKAWGPERLNGMRFGYWAWELPKAPKSWLRTASILDGLIAPSRFTAASLVGANVNVTTTPHPLVASDFRSVERCSKRPAGEAFRLVSLFDFRSSFARKNPVGAIDAFNAAFGDDPSVRLIIKSSNSECAPDLRKVMQDRAGLNVEILDGIWDRSQVLNFIASADALISLHRAEGFGLALAEAMILGVPVVATAWSGNLDFMDQDTSCLVESKLVPIVDFQKIYLGQDWAEPDVTSAAHHLRRLRDDRAFARNLATLAKAKVVERLSADAWFDSHPQELKEVFQRFSRQA